MYRDYAGSDVINIHALHAAILSGNSEALLCRWLYELLWSGADLEGARGVSFEPPFSTYNIILTVFPLPKLLPPLNQAKLERTKDLTRTQHLAVLFLINAHIHYSMCMSKHFYFC